MTVPDCAAAPLPCLSVILPASNEAELIGACLRSLLASELPAGGIPVEIIVVSNASKDATVEIAEGFAAKAAAKNWTLTVLEITEPGKLNALNVGDRQATGALRLYLDADVTLSPKLLAGIYHRLNVATPVYCSGQVQIPRPKSAVSRAYARIYVNVPFMAQGVPGCGLFSVNAAGRARWPAFPDIISDDTFVRLHFTGAERVLVPEPYTWPLVEGFGNLVRVRRRQDKGVAEIRECYPELLQNDDKPALGLKGIARLALSDPIGFATYASVALAVRLRRSGDNSWSRGR